MIFRGKREENLSKKQCISGKKKWCEDSENIVKEN